MTDCFLQHEAHAKISRVFQCVYVCVGGCLCAIRSNEPCISLTSVTILTLSLWLSGPQKWTGSLGCSSFGKHSRWHNDTLQSNAWTKTWTIEAEGLKGLYKIFSSLSSIMQPLRLHENTCCIKIHSTLKTFQTKMALFQNLRKEYKNVNLRLFLLLLLTKLGDIFK